MNRSYRVKRRAFLAGLGGAVGLQALLSGMEASAQGLPPPPRLLVMHWPLGTLRQRFLPTATGVNDGFVASPLLEPFDKAGLHDDMSVLYGLSHRQFRTTSGGGNEAGTVFAVTGADSPGTRQNGGESDDSVAGGPSFDQLFLSRVAELQRPGVGYVNAIADARVFSFETSTQCLSYSNETRKIPAAGSGDVIEHIPLMPETQPLALYNQVFSSVAPGAQPNAARNALLLRKSVLDYALAELKRLQSLAPASEREKIDIHAEAIRKLELQLQALLDGGAPSCMLPAAPAAQLKAKTGSTQINIAPAVQEDAGLVALIGKAHAAVIRAAFQCDLLRVATLQWCPGTNHVAFASMNPFDEAAIYEMGSFHYRYASDPSFFYGAPPAADNANAYVYETLFGMYRWLNQQTADVVAELKAAKDIYGGSLLDSTIVPYVTDQAQPTDERSPLPALILGGRALGMQGGKFVSFPSYDRSHNALWMTIAQAFLKSSDAATLLADEKFVKAGATAIPGLWAPPV